MLVPRLVVLPLLVVRLGANLGHNLGLNLCHLSPRLVLVLILLFLLLVPSLVVLPLLVARCRCCRRRCLQVG